MKTIKYRIIKRELWGGTWDFAPQWCKQGKWRPFWESGAYGSTMEVWRDNEEAAEKHIRAVLAYEKAQARGDIVVKEVSC